MSGLVDLSCSLNQPDCAACIARLNGYAETAEPLALIEGLAALAPDALLAKQTKDLSERAHVFVVRAFALKQHLEQERVEIEQYQKYIAEAEGKVGRLAEKNEEREKELAQLESANRERAEEIRATVLSRVQCTAATQASIQMMPEMEEELARVLQKIPNAQAALQTDKAKLAELSKNSKLWSSCVLL